MKYKTNNEYHDERTVYNFEHHIIIFIGKVIKTFNFYKIENDFYTIFDYKT